MAGSNPAIVLTRGVTVDMESSVELGVYFDFTYKQGDDMKHKNTNLITNFATKLGMVKRLMNKVTIASILTVALLSNMTADGTLA